MPLGRSIRIYLSDGSVAGIRHGEIVNWTGQAISCPRARFPELRDWPEAKKPGVYFLFGTDDETGQEAVYIGEAEVVLDRLATHVSGKDFWAEVIAFTSKDDNLTKGHFRYLESRLVQQAVEAGRYAVKNTASPSLPTLPRSDRDAMEEFLEATRVLLGVLGHRVLEPMLSPAPPAVARAPAPAPVPVPVPVPESSTNVAPSTPAPPATLPVTSPAIGIATNFKLSDRTLRAEATRTDEGLVVLKDSQAAATEQQSLSLSNRSIRARLVQAGVLVRDGNTLRFTRSQLFNSPSQAACVVVGYSINGRDAWRLPDGTTYGSYEERALSTVARIGTAQSGFPAIETERLLLREIVRADVPALFAIHGDPECMKWFGVDPLPDEASAEKLMEMFAGWRTMPNPGTRWGIQMRDQQTLLGTCGLFAWNRGWRKCTIGYELNPKVQGKGFMQEALRACIDWGFENMQLNRIEAQVHPSNEASIRSVERLGFKKEGVLRQIGFWNGQFHDMFQYALLSQDWRANEA